MMSQIRERCIRTGWLLVLTKEPKVIEKSRFQNIKRELVALSLPAFAGQGIEPMALLMGTAYIGPAQLASAGVSISIFNIVSKLFNIPLLSVATSFVAEDIANNSINSSSQEENSKEANGNGKAFVHTAERKQLASVSTALLLVVGIGISEGLALYFGSGLRSVSYSDGYIIGEGNFNWDDKWDDWSEEGKAYIQLY